MIVYLLKILKAVKTKNMYFKIGAMKFQDKIYDKPSVFDGIRHKKSLGNSIF